MTRARLAPRKMPPRTLRPLWLLLALVLLLAPGAPAQTGVPAQDEGRILIMMYTSTAPHGDSPYLMYVYVFNTTVEGEQDQGELRVSLPADTVLQDLRVQHETHPAPETQTRIDDEGAWAIAEWNETGPRPGTAIAMRLEARQEIDPESPITLHWDRLPTKLTSLRIALPATHTPQVGHDHAIQREAPLSGLDLWNLTRPPEDSFTFTIEPLAAYDDPSLGATPPAWSAPVVLIGLTLASATVWWLGKRSDLRKERQEREKRPPSSPPLG
jgi:hypothetical protein